MNILFWIFPVNSRLYQRIGFISNSLKRFCFRYIVFSAWILYCKLSASFTSDRLRWTLCLIQFLLLVHLHKLLFKAYCTSKIIPQPPLTHSAPILWSWSGMIRVWINWTSRLSNVGQSLILRRIGLFRKCLSCNRTLSGSLPRGKWTPPSFGL